MRLLVLYPQEWRENMKTRQEYAKLIRKLEILSTIFMTVGFLLSLIMNWGIYGIIFVVLIFLIFNIFSYRFMKICRCEYCNSIDIFTKKFGFTNGIKSHCPACHKKIKNTIKYIEKK